MNEARVEEQFDNLFGQIRIIKEYLGIDKPHVPECGGDFEPTGACVTGNDNGICDWSIECQREHRVRQGLEDLADYLRKAHP